MKKILLLLLVAFATRIAAQNNDYLVTPNSVGALKMGMKKAELEKLLGKKIILKNLLDKEGYSDTIKTKYKNIDVALYLERFYIEEEKYDIVLQGIKTSSPLCKTKAGIGIGDDKIKIITAYENNSLYIWPEYEDEEYTRRSKTKSVITVYDDKTGNSIIFYLFNKKVTAVEVTYSQEGD
jgi:transposase